MSSESRIWEIRPFGSMRGGGELVVGFSAFQTILPRLLYQTEKTGSCGKGMKGNGIAITGSGAAAGAGFAACCRYDNIIN